MARIVSTPYTNPVLQADAVWCASMLDAAGPTAKLIGCSPEAIVAQAALETGWGKAAIGNNVYGIKADSGWQGKRQLVTTREFIDGEYITIQDWFRDYDSIADSIADHFQFLKENTRYANVFDPDDTMSDADYFQHLQSDGYATAPDYAHQLMSVLATVKMFEGHMTETA